MRRVILFIASSLDGCIAGPMGEINWLFSDQDYGYTEFFAGVDTVVMGRLTYEVSLSFGEYPYKDRKGFVFSRTKAGTRDANVPFVGEEPGPFVGKLKKRAGKNVWLVGGAPIIQSCMIHDVIDEFVISIHPVILGDGIPLFRGPMPTTKLKLQDCQSFDTGLVQLTYSRRSIRSG
jgi:dihydrofolate reductase